MPHEADARGDPCSRSPSISPSISQPHQGAMKLVHAASRNSRFLGSVLRAVGIGKLTELPHASELVHEIAEIAVAMASHAAKWAVEQVVLPCRAATTATATNQTSTTHPRISAYPTVAHQPPTEHYTPHSTRHLPPATHHRRPVARQPLPTNRQPPRQIIVPCLRFRKRSDASAAYALVAMRALALMLDLNNDFASTNSRTVSPTPPSPEPPFPTLISMNTRSVTRRTLSTDLGCSSCPNLRVRTRPQFRSSISQPRLQSQLPPTALAPDRRYATCPPSSHPPSSTCYASLTPSSVSNGSVCATTR